MDSYRMKFHLRIKLIIHRKIFLRLARSFARSALKLQFFLRKQACRDSQLFLITDQFQQTKSMFFWKRFLPTDLSLRFEAVSERLLESRVHLERSVHLYFVVLCRPQLKIIAVFRSSFGQMQMLSNETAAEHVLLLYVTCNLPKVHSRVALHLNLCNFLFLFFRNRPPYLHSLSYMISLRSLLEIHW